MTKEYVELQDILRLIEDNDNLGFMGYLSSHVAAEHFKDEVRHLPSIVSLDLDKESNKTTDNSAWDFRWNGRGNYEQERAGFYGEFS